MSKKVWLLIGMIGLLSLLIGCGAPTDVEEGAQLDELGLPTAVPEAVVEDESVVVDEVTESGSLDPAGVTEAFYTWYLDTIGQTGTETMRNPLVEGTYKDSPYLTDRFISEVEETVAGFDQAGYDPILLAQDVPVAFEVEPPVIDGDEATTTLLRFWGGNPDPTPMQVHLVRSGDTWLIDEVSIGECPTSEASTPVEVATAFYEWYFAYIGEPGTENFRNPLVDRAYRDQLLLSEPFKEQIDELLDSFEGGGYDPFLMAQDIPRDFAVEPGPSPDSALIHLYFGTETVHDLIVSTEVVGSCRVITGIEEAATAELESQSATGSDTATFQSEDLGFSVDYPAGWVIEPLALEGPGMPDDWPVVAAWQIMPPDVAEALANMSGPPDTNAPPIVAPFQLEVVRGNQAALQRVYPELEGDQIEVNGVPATHVRMDPGYEHFIIPHPQLPDHWIVLTDWVTMFPGREEMASVAATARQQLLESLSFSS